MKLLRKNEEGDVVNVAGDNLQCRTAKPVTCILTMWIHRATTSAGNEKI
jgi:hypothetical protein